MIDTLYINYRHWSATGSVWLFSDPHFGDSDCKIMDKNWITPEEQIEIINSKVKKNDTLVLLGDIGNPEYLNNLKCEYKVLVCGNHDYSCLGKYRKYFEEIYTGPIFIAEKILLSHEPIFGLDWCLNIHGHDHSKLDDDKFHLNLAANVCGYSPINLKDIIKEGSLSKIKSLHRKTIDKASEDKTISLRTESVWAMGYLRYGHYRGKIYLNKQEYQKFRENPQIFIGDNFDEIKDSLVFTVDDYSIEDAENIDSKDIIIDGEE